MKHLLTAIACCLAVAGSAQVVDTTYYGNEVQINLNMSELSSTINQLQSDVSQLNGGQTSSNQASSTGVIIQYDLCHLYNDDNSLPQHNAHVAHIINCVNDSLVQGWSPLGSMTSDGRSAYQVIVKYSE